MRIRRTLLAAGGALGAAVLIAGCGSSGGVGGPEEVEQDTSEEVELTYWTWFPPETTLTAAIEAFEAENPNISVNLRVFVNTDYQQQLPLALSGGEDLDVVGVQVSAMTNSVREFLLPVDEWAGDWLGNLNEPMVQQTQDIADDDVLYSVPMGSIATPIVYYNAEMLEEAGAEVPTTVDEWKTAVDAVAATFPDVTPVVFQGEPYWQSEMLFGFAEQTSPGISDDINVDGGSWDQPAVVDGLNMYKSIFDAGVVDTDVLSLLGTRPSELFAAGEAAFYIDGSWQDSLLSQPFREANGIEVADVGATALPLADGGSQTVRAFAEGGLAIPAASDNVEAAATFIEFMVDTAGADVWAPDLVLLPSLDGYELPDTVLATEASQQGYAQVAQLIGNPSSIRTAQPDFNNVMGNMILDMLRGEATAEETAANMQAEWTSGRYGDQG
ncbi:sugar ABC transporter substrate-binding protein [Microbacterium awajiense]|uniref:Sugar ABC transporter substrate-binding protein n=1 Tax=Microbacterium awajiense TaxID=415214 RepID=A0ABP7ALV1_9MICO